MADKIWLLRRLNLLDGLAPDEAERMGRMFRMTTHAPRTRLDPARHNHIFLLKEGRLRLFRVTGDGREATTAVVVPGQLFGFGALLGRHTNATQAVVLEAAVVCEIAPSRFLALMASSPVLMSRVMVLMARQIVTLESHIEELALQAIPARLAHLLLEISTPADGTDIWVCDWSQEELASALASTRESIARILGGWRRRRLVEVGRRHLVIRDRAAIQRLADQT